MTHRRRSRTLSSPTTRTIRLGRLRDQGGFTLVELVATTVVFLAVAAPLGAVLSTAGVLERGNRQVLLADEMADSVIESARALPYDSVGTSNGNPPGDIPAVQTLSNKGLTATVTTRVSYVNDRVPTAVATEADYKRITVTVQRSTDGHQLTQKSTFVSAATAPAYGGANYVIVKATVIDLVQNAPLPGTVVTLQNGPSPLRTDTADAAGYVSFPALTANPTTGPQAYYDLTSALSGYVQYKDDTPPRTPAHAQLAPGQTFTTTIRMYKPATVLVNLVDSTGQKYAGNATVTIGSSRGGQTFTWSNGMAPITSIAGEPVVPGLTYTVSAQTSGGYWAPAVSAPVPPAYPTNLISSLNLALGTTQFTTRTLTVTVRKNTAPVANALVTVSGGPASTYLTGVTNGQGQVALAVPSGSQVYTVGATGSAGEGTGTTSNVVVTANTSTGVNLS
jgi:hypothetical protein